MRIIFTILVLLFGLASTPVAAQLKVGFIGSLSGSAAAYGVAAKNGIELALEEISPDKRPQVFYEDDEFNSSKTILAFRKLSAQNVDLIFTIGSNTSKAVSPLAQSLKLPMIAWASDSDVSLGNDYVVRSYPSGHSEGVTNAEEIKRRGLKSVAAIISSNAYSSLWLKGVKASLGSSLIANEELASNVPDFRSLILRVIKLKPDHLAICLNPGQNGTFAKQLRQLQSVVTISGCEYLSDSSEIKAAGASLQGSWYAAVEVNDGFRARYLSRFGNTDVISGAANHYDAVKMLASLPQGTDKAQIITLLLEMPEYHGIAGPFKVRNHNGDRFFDIPLAIRFVD